MVDTDIDRLSFLNHLMLLLRLLTPVTSHLPSSITKVSKGEVLKEVIRISSSQASENDSAQAVESVVGLWTRESSHNYENNSRVSEEFHCPSAVRFSLDFDSRCCTERRLASSDFTITADHDSSFICPDTTIWSSLMSPAASIDVMERLGRKDGPPT